MSHYNDSYHNQVKALRDWFKAKLSTLPPVVLTKAQYRSGTDSLKEPYRPILDQAFAEWMAKRQYELSYNQMCCAFFDAARELGKIEVRKL